MWPYAITRLTAHFVCVPDVWSGDLQVYHKYDHAWHWMSLLRSGVIKQYKLKPLGAKVCMLAHMYPRKPSRKIKLAIYNHLGECS